MKRHILAILLGLTFPAAGVAALPAIDTETAGTERMAGFVDLYWDADGGRLLLRIDRMEAPFIYQSSLARGVGSNDLGLDRGQLGATRLVEFRRSGPKVLLVERNTDYRATTDNPEEAAAVEHSFARSVIWGFEAVAADGNAVLVDATGFFIRDAHDLTTRLQRARQGRFTPDEGRSAIYLPRTRAFPDNTEVEALVTYVGDRAFDATGQALSDILPTVVPDGHAITVHLHHSFVRLPDTGYEPLPLDPRAGLVSAGSYIDYGSAIGEPLRVTLSRRHRLQCVDPGATPCEPVEPIVYHVDPGAPEPVRSALIEGARWWNDAFEAAGYRNAFQVELLPPDADPMDVRYNVIQWVHRSTRGWSYGSSVLDPRSGEILKGHVTLGSLRVRQDYLIAEGLLAPYRDGEVPDRMLDMALARIRQLSAHEVGHTLGLSHNFAASVNDRASVMDYPFPLIRFDDDGGLDLSDAYGVGVAEWDRRTVDYAYRDFPDGVDAVAARGEILDRTIADGLLFVADADSRDPGTAHPYGNLWDNGDDAIAEFRHLLKVREYALGRFTERIVRPDRPLALVEEALVPVYLLHRYQIQAVGKLLGGEYFRYKLRGDGQPLPRTVDGSRQRDALETLVGGMAPDVLALPTGVIDLIPPRPPGYRRDRETFDRSTGATFDPLAPAASAVSLTLDVLMHPRRAARMNALHARDAGLPGFDVVLRSLADATWRGDRAVGMEGAIQRQTGRQALGRMMATATDPGEDGQVRAQALAAVRAIDAWLGEQRPARLPPEWAAHYALARQDIAQMLSDPNRAQPARRTAPPGSPIGGG